MVKKLLGEITHYYGHINVAVVKVKSAMKVGDKVLIEGPQVSFEQAIKSMQIDQKPIKAAKAKQEIGLKVDQEVKNNYKIYSAT
ncbi:MAG TPA: U32 family peptidase C-terminal domain-containing protein [Candidatus Nanoarchaeia archaeon]|nr:U32 family peptidase C-terminal domain-containing protein [Candidatus Nanoarchaeia archaeon]